jgi:hypothetical protein
MTSADRGGTLSEAPRDVREAEKGAKVEPCAEQATDVPGSWNALSIPFFESVCRDVFDDYMRQAGFTETDSDELGTVAYFRRSTAVWAPWIFVSFEYWPEDAPDYSPMVNVGFADSPVLSPALTLTSIGLWCAIPKETDALRYSSWPIRTVEAATESLVKIRDVVDMYARPLWQDPAQLAAHVAKLDEESAREEAEEARERLAAKKERAGRAFWARNYREVLNIYQQLDEAHLSEIDRKRIKIARRLTAEKGPESPGKTPDLG